ncbi:MAG: YwaF family protein [Candidatus Izemoplasmatales bacterium]|nr:YwaF family protein [Candidatus Izemoplasmatales bacterium]MDD4595741.1 YwaF family protein [Candidatus Izemoplasmatales bacterium]
MYNLDHILYIIFSLMIIVIFSIIFKNVSARTRINIMRIIAMLTIITHVSTLFYNYFVNPNNTIFSEKSTIYPYYFCNLMMILLPITFCGPKVLRPLYPFVLWGAFFGGMITTAVPEFYNGGNLFTIGVFKSFLSHSFMILAFTYATVSGEYKIRLKDMWVFPLGLLFCGVIGVFNNFLWTEFALGEANSMYLNAPALEGTPFNGYVIALIMMVVVYSTAFVIETIRKKKSVSSYEQKELIA